MTLFMIGLGLNDEKDITVKGLEAVKNCEYVYLEDYTSKLSVPASKLEKFYDKKITIADRNLVESNADKILDKAISKNVAFLVVGNVFGATTHVDLFLRAKEKNIEVKVIHNTSILSAVGQTGLELYRFGKTTSMPFFEPSFKPETPYEATKTNLANNLHTLILLDIKKDINKYMTVNVALKQLLEIEKKRKENVFTENLMVIGCARLGSESPTIKYGKVSKLINFDFGEPLHCLIVPGKMHFMEEDMLNCFAI